MMRADALLFCESQSCIIVSIKERDLNRLEEIAENEGAPLQVIGEVGGSRFMVQPFIQLPAEELKSIWSSGLEKRLQWR
jgi:phosphoribosylformylglycinamidine (FGAM) synthase-like enzyme